MTATDIAAWWGAITATLVLLWDVYTWKKSGAILKVTALPNMQLSPQTGPNTYKTKDEKHISVAVANTGKEATTLPHLVGAHYKSLLDKLLRRNPSYFAALGPIGARLPHRLEVGGQWTGLLVQTDNLENQGRNGLLYIGVNDASKDKATMVRVKIKENSNR